MTMSPDLEPKPRRAPMRALAALAVVALLVGIAVAFGPWMKPRATEPPDAGAPVDTGEGAIGRALAVATDDDSLSRWVEEVPGVELASLDPGRRTMFVRYANAERCTCGCGYTLAACRVYDDQCEVSGPRVAALFDSVLTGRIRSAEGLRERP